MQEHVDEQVLMRTVMDLVPAMLGYWDAQLRNQYANSAYLEWFGMTPEQMRGKHISEVIGPHLYELNLPYLQAALGGEPQHFDRTIVDAAGVTRYTSASYLPDVAADGAVRGISVLVADVTELVLARQQADEQQARVAQLSEKLRIVANVGASVHELDPDRLQDAVVDAVLALGFDGAILVLSDDTELLAPRHGRGIFSVLDGARIRRTSTIAHEVLRDHTIRYIEDYQAFPSAIPAILATGVRSVAAIPVRSAGEVLGVLQAGRRHVEPLSDDDREVLGLLADMAGTSLRHARSFLDLRRTSDELAAEVARDPLTGIGNRRAADQMLGATRPGDALVVLDLDHFKRVNDTRGHAAGDTVLRRMASQLAAHLRARDQVARLGGEEFLLTLPSTPEQEALRIVSRLQQEWSRIDETTFSAGIAIVLPDESGTAAQHRADAALYEAKNAGRDRVEIAAPRTSSD
jgi:diguanylate cyclase (GGDEF)-like protein/PAS domain S-box-containing protein